MLPEISPCRFVLLFLPSQVRVSRFYLSAAFLQLPLPPLPPLLLLPLLIPFLLFLRFSFCASCAPVPPLLPTPGLAAECAVLDFSRGWLRSVLCWTFCEAGCGVCCAGLFAGLAAECAALDFSRGQTFRRAYFISLYLCFCLPLALSLSLSLSFSLSLSIYLSIYLGVDQKVLARSYVFGDHSSWLKSLCERSAMEFAKETKESALDSWRGMCTYIFADPAPL